MKILYPTQTASEAMAANPSRPATAVVHDSPDVRLLVFRLRPGQSVSPHQNASTVLLTVLAGSGMVSDADSERSVVEGDMVCYEPNELHGMQATDQEFLILATIAPRPGIRSGA